MARVPSLVAFDLDDTLWSPEMWECSGPPFKTLAGRVYDRSGTEIELIGASQRVLHELATQVCVQHAGHYSRKTTHAKTRLHHVERASVVRAGLFRPRRGAAAGCVQIGFGGVKAESLLWTSGLPGLGLGFPGLGLGFPGLGLGLGLGLVRVRVRVRVRELGSRRGTCWLENPGRRTSVLESLHHSLHSARRA